ncbi:hypothetical protein EZJ58_2336 [Sodalis ligni]|uniref:Uncharacterized protein n=1 Tax=Sodalis ligni TaxID=2697027 RepID=A0A4R1NA08_9GAMM|nr:hypothetical protein EZJ58_2336 [Sodalis ligni]
MNLLITEDTRRVFAGGVRIAESRRREHGAYGQ